MSMPLVLEGENEGMRQAIAGFAQSQLAEKSIKLLDGCNTDAERFQKSKPIYEAATAAGLIKGQVGQPLGGDATSNFAAAVVVEECYAVNCTVSLTIFGTGLGLTPLMLAGNPEQHKEYLAPFLDKQGAPLASLVYSEPTGSANYRETAGAGIQTTARLEGDEYVINGEKVWATNCAGWDFEGAELQCILCKEVTTSNGHVNGNGSASNGHTNGHATNENKSMLLLVRRSDIDANAKGAFTVKKHMESAGHKATSGPHVAYKDLRVPKSALLGAVGQGLDFTEAAFTISAAIVGAMSVGIMRHAFEVALAFSKKQTRGGSVEILQHQSVADLLSDVKARIEASRLLTWKALALFDAQGMSPGAKETALHAKVFCSDSAVKSVVDCMSAVGVSAYSSEKDMPLASLLNDAICLPLFDGGNVGVRRRQLQKLMLQSDYKLWATCFGQ